MSGIDLPALLAALLVLIFSLTIHEAAHAWSASWLGDETARRLGRVSLNPMVHVDPVGTLLLPAVAMISSAPIIGWAKPTPVNARNLRHPRRDRVLVTAAGPISNLLLAVVSAFILQLAPGSQLASQFLFLNVLLAVFNLLPIPPLDGGQILLALLPRRAAAQLAFLSEYGFLILMVLLVMGVLELLINPPYYLILSWLR